MKTTLEKHYWRKLLTVLLELGTPVETIDNYPLGMMVCHLTTVEECREELREIDIHLEVSNDRGYIVRERNPLFDLLKKSQAQVKHYLSQFKMSPAALELSYPVIHCLGMIRIYFSCTNSDLVKNRFSIF